MSKKNKTISCYEVKHFIRAYLVDDMSIEEAERFVHHIRSCPACRAELEEYYAFSSALMQLDSMEDAEKGNFFMNIEKRLERTEATAVKYRKDHWRRRVTFFLVALLVAAAMGVSMGA